MRYERDQLEVDSNRRHTVESFDSLRRQVEAMGLLKSSRTRVFGELVFVVLMYALATLCLGTLASYGLATIAAITLVWWIHDAGHAAFFEKKETSTIFIETLGVLFLGMPQIEYHFEVHRIHHAHTNIIGRDGALQTGPVKWHQKQLKTGAKYLKAQSLLWFFVALPLTWPLITSRCVKTMWARKNYVRLALLTARWAIALTVFSNHLPFLFIPTLIAGFVLGFVSSLNHFHMPIDDRKQDLFPMSVFITTQNLNERGFFATWITGGLNFHIEHHLFPTMPSKNLRHVQPLVEKFARENGLQYEACASLRAVSKLHRRLRQPMEAS
jgi:fatty acid desaturase